MSTDDSRLSISSRVSIPLGEIELSAIRASGPGGQNVNKVSTAVQLRFDIDASSLPEFYKERLSALKDRRITTEGVVIIKAQRYRSQEKNREDALGRLRELVQSVAATQAKRVPTRPTRSSQQNRMDRKTQRGRVKELRKRVLD